MRLLRRQILRFVARKLGRRRGWGCPSRKLVGQRKTAVDGGVTSNADGMQWGGGVDAVWAGEVRNRKRRKGARGWKMEMDLNWNRNRLPLEARTKS